MAGLEVQSAAAGSGWRSTGAGAGAGGGGRRTGGRLDSGEDACRDLSAPRSDAAAGAGCDRWRASGGAGGGGGGWTTGGCDVTALATSALLAATRAVVTLATAMRTPAPPGAGVGGGESAPVWAVPEPFADGLVGAVAFPAWLFRVVAGFASCDPSGSEAVVSPTPLAFLSDALALARSVRFFAGGLAGSDSGAPASAAYQGRRPERLRALAGALGPVDGTVGALLGTLAARARLGVAAGAAAGSGVGSDGGSSAAAASNSVSCSAAGASAGASTSTASTSGGSAVSTSCGPAASTSGASTASSTAAASTSGGSAPEASASGTSAASATSTASSSSGSTASSSGGSATSGSTSTSTAAAASTGRDFLAALTAATPRHPQPAPPRRPRLRHTIGLAPGPALLDECELAAQPVTSGQLAGADVDLPLGALLPALGPVLEPHEPDLVVQLVRAPRRRELVLQECDPSIEQVPGHRLVEWGVGATPLARLDVDDGAGQLDHLGLLGEDRDGEALHPLDVDVGLVGHRLGRPPGPETSLDLPRRQVAVAMAGGRRRLVGATARLARPRAIAAPLGLGDGIEKVVLEGNDVATGL